MATYQIVTGSLACGEGGKKILVPFKYGIGSTVFIIDFAKLGIMDAVVITNLSFIKNVRTYNKYFVLYNSTWYEDEICDEACARGYAIAYWTAQEEWVLRQLSC